MQSASRSVSQHRSDHKISKRAIASLDIVITLTLYKLHSFQFTPNFLKYKGLLYALYLINFMSPNRSSYQQWYRNWPTEYNVTPRFLGWVMGCLLLARMRSVPHIAGKCGRAFYIWWRDEMMRFETDEDVAKVFTRTKNRTKDTDLKPSTLSTIIIILFYLYCWMTYAT